MSSDTSTGRRALFRKMGVAVGVLAFPRAMAESTSATSGGTEVQRHYPRQRVGLLSRLPVGAPYTFSYPDEGHTHLLVKLGRPADSGVGPDGDVVAFSTVCPHMGCAMPEQVFRPSDSLLGPCPCHFSCFDLTRQGMMVQGQATESLPQVMLEVDGDELYAIGIRGLIYGRNDNLAGAKG